jgi:drug/metabolite transporter superfamily protein YnfA
VALAWGFDCAKEKHLASLAGTFVLVLCGVIPTLQPANDVYPAYGGVFVVRSIPVGQQIDKVQPDNFGNLMVSKTGIAARWRCEASQSWLNLRQVIASNRGKE